MYSYVSTCKGLHQPEARALGQHGQVHAPQRREGRPGGVLVHLLLSMVVFYVVVFLLCYI